MSLLSRHIDGASFCIDAAAESYEKPIEELEVLAVFAGSELLRPVVFQRPLPKRARMMSLAG